MSEETTEEVDATTMAPGLIQAFAPQEEEEPQGDRRRRKKPDDAVTGLRKWVPKTRLGHEVMAGRIITFEAAMASGLPIREVEIVDALMPTLEDDIIRSTWFRE